MEQIKSRIFNYGNPHESDWPSEFGTGEKGYFVYDKEQKKVVPPEERSYLEVNAPHIQTDEMDPLVHHADGKVYTSKSAFRRTTTRLGFIEVGDQTEYRPKKQEDPKALEKMEECVARSYYKCRDNMAPLSELDRHRCQIMNRNVREYNYDRRERNPDGSVKR